MRTNGRNDGAGGPSRRTVLSGVGGVGVLSLVGAAGGVAGAVESLAELETDPHTRDTYRALVDALVPATPALADELGPEHEPGALEIELERFVIWGLDNAEEIRAEGLTSDRVDELAVDLDADALDALVDGILEEHSLATRSLLETLGLADADGAFGDLEGLSISVRAEAEVGPAAVELTVETDGAIVEDERRNYPYAPVFAVVFDLVALEFLARGRNEDEPGIDERYPAGGAYARLAPRDRLRCLEWILDGGVVDALDEELGDLVGTPGSVKYVVTAIHALATIGYYSEWAGYGETKTDRPSERELETPVDEVQSRLQTGYPGPAPGYADHRGFELKRFKENDYGGEDA